METELLVMFTICLPHEGDDSFFTDSTSIDSGKLLVSGSLSNSTVVAVSSGATYQLAAADTIGGLQGSGTTDLNGNGSVSYTHLTLPTKA